MITSNIQRMYKAIRHDFKEMSVIQENGARKYTTEYIICKLSEKYYRSPSTIENIIFNRV